MPSHTSESLVLRTYPYREGDLIVGFLTREQGKLRGVARRARRPKSPFGSGLERLSHVRMSYYQKETVELVKLDSCELIESQFGLLSGEQAYENGIALDFMTEVADLILPDHEPNERFFRLLLVVLAELRRAAGPVWKPILYYTLWAVRLQGFLPNLRVSDESHELAEQILTKPIAALPARAWDRTTARDLRRHLIRLIEEHAERRVLTAQALEAIQ